MAVSANSDRRIALVDVNNFYASCETVFNPKLGRRAVVVLSNNDGCVVARNPHSKAMGICMGEPWHLIGKDKQKLITAFSSNYTLYADMSKRVMSILADMAPSIEVYSIDESFIDLTGMDQLVPYGQKIKHRIAMWTGLPVCVGIASTKTRAKLANHIAKKNAQFDGVFDLEGITSAEQEHWFSKLPVDEVWGIGGRTAIKLKQMQINSVDKLLQTSPKQLRAKFGVVLERIVSELNGVPCAELELTAPPKKQIVSSRSFGRTIESETELRESVLSHVSRGAEKLRIQGSVAGSVNVFIATNTFKSNVPQYINNITIKLPFASDDTLLIGKAAVEGLQRIYRPGFQFKKAGIMLGQIEPKSTRQLSIFEEPAESERREKLNSMMDTLNQRYGSGTIKLAGSGIKKGWQMNRANLSPRYTTCWSELPVAR